MRLPAVAALVLAATGVTSPQEQPAPDTGKKYVSIAASVVDRGGTVVANLQKQDFTVLDNGAAQEIILFQNTPRPFTVVVLLDMSRSMASNLRSVKAAVEQFIGGLLPEDAGQLGAFSDRIDFGRRTNDRNALIRGLDVLPAGNPSRFHDALDASVDLLEGIRGHKVILVFTDGQDTASGRRFDDVVAKARSAGVIIYAVGVDSEIVNGVRAFRSGPAASLRRFAEETGGRFFELKKITDASTFANLAHELRTVYTMGFIPTKLDGRNHKLQIHVKPGLTVRARRGYIASPERLTALD